MYIFLREFEEVCSMVHFYWCIEN